MRKFKIFSLLILVLLYSCSNNDDSDSDNQSCINPPDWLIGTWIHYDGDVEENKYIFSENNIIEFTYDISRDLRETYCDKEFAGITTEQEYTSEFYLFKWILTSGGTSIPNDLYFFKVDDNTMNFSNWSDGEPSITYIKQ
ncbi:hypothetical protein [Bizionia sp.]|uniref:hypothetical protein n=1 Tax=Bizionia sp. TaxID=1954480 RepID=UPI003A940FC1